MSMRMFGLILLFGPPSCALLWLGYRSIKDASLRYYVKGFLVACGVVAWVSLSSYLLSGSK